ncbi:hypothetical protein E2C01_066080 [Portunus trituberculatus]|uniref:Uncharacterized protein n=1 Tax=Portunus trituberculatus TaxID=210409 RepID=A0A5B7HG78_PORTR|nr:hypothetical protein [Portunus trituberculatus]
MRSSTLNRMTVLFARNCGGIMGVETSVLQRCRTCCLENFVHPIVRSGKYFIGVRRWDDFCCIDEVFGQDPKKRKLYVVVGGRVFDLHPGHGNICGRFNKNTKKVL